MAAVLAIAGYATGIGTGFASDDYGWLRRGVDSELGWNVSFNLTSHFNGLPFEIALYHLKFLMFGFNVVGYHLFALAGHLVNVVLVYALARRLGMSVRVASLASGFAAVLAAGTQAVYWMSGDPHVFAALFALLALILYIDHREKGGWWRYVAAVAFAVVAPLIKAEGVAVVGGVVAYELIRQKPVQMSWKLVPFVIAPVPFVWWEWTTSDQLSTHRGFGLNVVSSGIDYLRQLVLPLNPSLFIQSPGSFLHRGLNISIGAVLLAEALALGALLLLGLGRRPSWVLVVVAITGTAPAMVVTLGTQPRYIYFAGLVLSPVMAAGAATAFKWAWDRFSHQTVLNVATLLLAVVISVQTWMTGYEAGALRAAHGESIAFRTAVLKDHPSVADGTPICVIRSPLDPGTATAVFADPRLGPNVGIPSVSTCSSAAAAPSGAWVYQRAADGTYTAVQ